MEIRPADYEKLGVFYLGREFDPDAGELRDRLVLYDSKDLVTHAVVLGMTGSGKTGLCISLLEEAAMDLIPAIVIDPKGDISNLLLTFPELSPAEFREWIPEDEAKKKGLTADELAERTAAAWRDGLAAWGQGPERIAALRERAEVVVFTPGSTAGIPVSVLRSFDAPPRDVVEDAESFSTRIESTASALLSLVGVDADPLQSPQALLLANLLGHEWRAGRGLTLEALIRLIQQPPFDKVGVIDLESFLPAKARQELALRLNHLLASPGFAHWLEGVPLDLPRLLHDPAGKPRVAVFSIAHLGEAERMFFVGLLLGQVLGWMRSQAGTNSLRALLYMDELFGFLPPTANPPSKKPLLTLLKQGRAAGLGCVLATQNPADLDYKALSNAGTWILGRLQTERDKLRVLDGLQGAAGSEGRGFDRAQIERILTRLAPRTFLMHNVHEDGPVVFRSRWAMSYLRGPLTRAQLRKLTNPLRGRFGVDTDAGPAATAAAGPMSMPGAGAVAAAAGGRPVLGPGVVERFVPVAGGASGVVYRPALLRVGTVRFRAARSGVEGSRSVCHVHALGLQGIEREHEIPLPCAPEALEPDPAAGAGFAELPGYAMNAATYKQEAREFADQLYHHQRAEVLHCPALKESARFGESEGEFRARLVHKAHEARDAAVAKLRAATEAKLRTLQGRLRSAEGTLARQTAEARSAKMQAGLSILGGVLGGLLGRKSGFGVRGATATAGRATSAYKQHQDVAVAADKVSAIHEEIARLEQQTAEAIEAIGAAHDIAALELATESLRPTRAGVTVELTALVWIPAEGPAR